MKTKLPPPFLVCADLVQLDRSGGVGCGEYVPQRVHLQHVQRDR